MTRYRLTAGQTYLRYGYAVADITAYEDAWGTWVKLEDAEALQAALAAMTEHYVRLISSGDCGHWDPETEAPVIRARQLLDAPAR